MSRLSLSINLVLLAIVLTLGWKLYDLQTEKQHVPAPTQSAMEKPIASGEARAQPDPLTAISARLTAIDARLSAIERGQGADKLAVQKQEAANKAIGPQAAALANERLAAIVSGKEFDQNAMVGFNIALAKLPEDEQIALAAALSQAINQGRVRLKK